MATVRICVCGDDGTGKSSLITSLVKDVFVTNKIQPVLPTVTLPPTLGTPDNVTTVIVDTSALPHERDNLRKEVRKSNVILLVYSDHYSYERVALFWMPYFRSQGVNVPVVLCANKSDLVANGNTSQVVEDEMLPVMAEFKEIDSCIRTSAREHHNVNEVFFLCQKAVTHPIAPLYDSKELSLKPAAITALTRIFYLCDKDQDGVLNDEEVRGFQMKVFEKSLSDEELTNIKRSIQPPSNERPGSTHGSSSPPAVPTSVDLAAFIRLATLFIQKGRHETLWMILRKYHYTDSLSLQPTFLSPKFDIPPGSSAELSPVGYRFFVDLFLLFDKDNDGGLSASDVDALFAPTPGLPALWAESDFPSCTVRSEAGHVTLQGWLAQWSMTTFEEPQTTLAYLAWLGFETRDRGGTTTALKVTPPRSKHLRRTGADTKKGATPTPHPRRSKANKQLKVERSVFLCYVLGAPHAGKTALLSAFLARPFDPTYHPTIRPLVAANSVELAGGKQCTLILRELGQQESAILDNTAKVDAADAAAYVYDSSDADSFAHISALRARHPALAALPAVFCATKADRDKAVQAGTAMQPEEYTRDALGLPEPLHLSVCWGTGVQELFVLLAESATYPASALPSKGGDEERADRTSLYVAAVGAAVCAIAAVAIVWRKNLGVAAS